MIQGDEKSGRQGFREARIQRDKDAGRQGFRELGSDIKMQTLGP